jgi:hypothetical protein
MVGGQRTARGWGGREHEMRASQSSNYRDVHAVLWQDGREIAS